MSPCHWYRSMMILGTQVSLAQWSPRLVCDTQAARAGAAAAASGARGSHAAAAVASVTRLGRPRAAAPASESAPGRRFKPESGTGGPGCPAIEHRRTE